MQLTTDYLTSISFVEEDKPITVTATQTLDAADCAYLNGVQTCNNDPYWHLDRIDQRATTLNRMYNYNSKSVHTSVAFSPGSKCIPSFIPKRTTHVCIKCRHISSHRLFTDTGHGVNIYVIDTGVRASHPNFQRLNGSTATRVVQTINFATDNRVDDCNGHGTHVGGLAAGLVSGVAKDASIHSLRTLDCTGTGNLTSTLSALVYVSNNAAVPSIVVMSLGVSEISLSLGYYAQALSRQGHILVTAAGNSRANACGNSPAFVPDLITVGATTKDDQFASFSDRGPCVDIVSPGVSMLSSYGTGYAFLSGTSMATPVVGGTVALMLQTNPTLNFNTTIRLLQLAATVLPPARFPNTTSGLVYTSTLQVNPVVWKAIPGGAGARALVDKVQILDGMGSVDSTNSSLTRVAVFSVLATYMPSATSPIKVTVSLSDPSYGTVTPSSFMITDRKANQTVDIEVQITQPTKVRTSKSFFVDLSIETELSTETVPFTVEVQDLRSPTDPASGTTPLHAVPVLSLPFSYNDYFSKYNNTFDRICTVSADVSGSGLAYSAIGNGPEVWFSIQARSGCDGPGSNTCTIRIDTCASSADTITYLIPPPSGSASYYSTGSYSCVDDSTNRALKVDNCPEGSPLANVLNYQLTVGVPYMIVVDSYIRYPDSAYQGTVDVRITTISGEMGDFEAVAEG